MKLLCTILITHLIAFQLAAQTGNQFKGENEPDTIYFVELDTFNITARSLHNYNYSRYEMIVAKVYPFADTAIVILKEMQAVTAGLSKARDEKKYKKELEDKLRDKFEDKLKNLSRSQGEVLIDIIERNTGQSMYDILKDVKSGSTAFWWQNLGKAYGYDLKNGYYPDNNQTLEDIIVAYENKHKKK